MSAETFLEDYAAQMKKGWEKALGPLQAAMKSKKLPPHERRSLRGLCSRGHWCQARVARAFPDQSHLCTR
eukprot:8723642-Pyramimonas_sp.AAC.1